MSRGSDLREAVWFSSLAMLGALSIGCSDSKPKQGWGESASVDTAASAPAHTAAPASTEPAPVLPGKGNTGAAGPLGDK